MIGAPIPEVICDQANIQKPTFHLENAGCLRGVCSPCGPSLKDLSHVRYYPLQGGLENAG